jgi:hypothetical protein
MEKYLKGVETVYKKIICITMILAMIFPLLPGKTLAEGYVKEIDAEFSNMEIQIEGKKISNHKEPFVYNDEIWVPLKDLGRGLDLNVKFNKNKKSISLDSKGKLKKSIDKSTASYQRGYEIEAKEKIMKNLEDQIDILQYGKSFTKNEDYIKKAKIRNIKVYFGDIHIYLDGKELNLNVEPIMYNDDVYIPIDSISPYLYIIAEYKEDKSILAIQGNGILVKNKDYSILDDLLVFRESRNYLLDIQLAQLEKRKEIVGDLKIPYKKVTNVIDLETYLNSYFSKVGELSTEIHIGKSVGNWLYLDISFPYSGVSKWYQLQRRDVEDWIWDIYTAILNIYDEDVLLYGSIRNPYYNKYSNSSNKNYVTFDTRDKDLYFDFTKSNLKKDYRFDPIYLAETLNKTLNKYNKIEFSYNVKLSGDDVELIAYSGSNDFANSYLYTKMGYLKRLNWEIKRVYPDLEVNGQIVFPNNKYSPIRFNLKDNRIRSVDLLNETEEYLNIHYGSFSYGMYSFNLKYSIYENGSNEFKLVAEGDFSLDDEKWIRAGETGEQRLVAKVQNAISYCIAIWDANISTEIVDKNQITISEVDIYRNNVGVVYANPSSGEVKEGTKVYLYTDTPGADIYYTLDGSTPTTSSTKYTGPITISRDVEINAFGYKDGLGASPISTFEYKVVLDDNWSYGLKDLKISSGILTPSFARDILEYELHVDGNADNIVITPYGDGTIKINGNIVESGSGKVVNLVEGKNTINISVKEENKKERIYTIVVYRGNSQYEDIDIKNLQFNTTLVAIFKGQLYSSTISNFNGYKVELLSRAGQIYKTTNVSSSGTFEIKDFPIDPISKIIGYKYRIYDGGGKLILERDLN